MAFEILDKVVLFLMLLSLVVSYIVAFNLYKNSLEKEEMSFNKYLNAMMMDVSFTKDKKLLIYEGERLKVFNAYRVFILGVVCVVFCFGFYLFLLK